MRRIAYVFGPLSNKKDDDKRTKRSWKSWLKRRPLIHHTDDDDYGSLSTVSTVLLDPLISFTTQSLAPQSYPPPLSPDSFFPRSANHSAILPRPRSLRTHVLKSAILHRYENLGHEEPCSLSDFPNISRPPVSNSSSPGIRRWLSRPCFEDRNVVYTPQDDAIIVSQVSASLPVAAIEYSDFFQFMADPSLLRPIEPPVPVTGMLFLDLLFHFIHHPFIDVPLPPPQRNQHPPSQSPSNNSEPSPLMTPTSPSTNVKRVVRFAADDDQDDDDDAIPLHLIRQKKLREQKSKFIRQERLRRAREEELNRRHREKEAQEKQRERALIEAQRVQADKERKLKEQAILTEEVVKARLRRELQRAGGVPALVMRDHENDLNFGVISSSVPGAGERNRPHLSSSSSTASLRGVRAPITFNNPQRDSSVDPSSLHLQPQHYQSTSDSSPASSRRSSIHTPNSNNPSPLYRSHFNSRPPSSYSSSSESIGKRNSFMPLMGPTTMGMMSPGAMQTSMMQMPLYAVPQPIIMNYPPFAPSNPNISYNSSQVIPPFSPVPNSFVDFMPNEMDMQMPLLPPAAPFMKQTSYERRKTSEKETGERNSRPASLRSIVGSKKDSAGPSSEWAARERSFSATSPSTGAGERKLISGRPGQGHPQQRSSSGPAISFSTGPRGQPTRASTMSTSSPVPSPWTGVPTIQQRQQQAQLATSSGASKGGTGGQSVSGASSSTVKKRGSIMSGIGKSIGKNKSKATLNPNKGRRQAITG